MQLNDVLRKVRALIDKAEHPATPIAEAASARVMADTLMLKFSIDQANLDSSRPAEQRSKPGDIKVDLCDIGSVFEQYLRILCERTARYARCQVVFNAAGMKVNQKNADLYKSYGYKVTAHVFGYESDLRYFELLWTTLHLHMASGLEPKWDESKSDAENAYILHNAGLSWADMARMRNGKHPQGWDGVTPRNSIGWYWRNLYWDLCDQKGEPRTSIRARKVYQMNFAEGYVNRVTQRLRDAQYARAAGADLVLRDQGENIAKTIADTYPKLKSLRSTSVKHDPRAYGKGDAHGRAADLQGSNRMGASNTKGIGA